MANWSRKQAIVTSTLVIVGLLAWVTWPTVGQLNVESCTPDGLFAKLSDNIYGKAFWRAQLADIAQQRKSAENWDQIQAEIQAKINEIHREVVEPALNAFFAEHPSLAPKGAEITPERLRALAEKIEKDEIYRSLSEFMRKRVPVLKKCEEAIVGRLQ